MNRYLLPLYKKPPYYRPPLGVGVRVKFRPDFIAEHNDDEWMNQIRGVIISKDGNRFMVKWDNYRTPDGQTSEHQEYLTNE